MAKKVGLSRAIKLEWLNKTAEYLLEEKSKTQVKDELNEYLSYEIKSATNLRKTREILLATWANNSAEILSIKQQALDSFKTEDGRLAAHWSLLLVTYPVFSDICSLIGKITNIQDTFATAWLKDKLFEEWGERATLQYSVEKILQTLKLLGVIEPISSGVYKIVKKTIRSKKAIEVLLSAILYLNEKAYYETSELNSISKLFPFEFDVPYEWLHNSETFTLNRFGGKVVLTR
jgi:hypothetical protein